MKHKKSNSESSSITETRRTPHNLYANYRHHQLYSRQTTRLLSSLTLHQHSLALTAALQTLNYTASLIYLIKVRCITKITPYIYIYTPRQPRALICKTHNQSYHRAASRKRLNHAPSRTRIHPRIKIKFTNVMSLTMNM